jgi:hypothetical protein
MDDVLFIFCVPKSFDFRSGFNLVYPEPVEGNQKRAPFLKCFAWLMPFSFPLKSGTASLIHGRRKVFGGPQVCQSICR